MKVIVLLVLGVVQCGQINAIFRKFYEIALSCGIVYFLCDLASIGIKKDTIWASQVYVNCYFSINQY